MQRKLVVQVILAVLILAALLVAFRFLPLAVWFTHFRDYVRGLGPIGYVVYALVYAICVAALVPSSLLSVGAGAIFGLVGGSIVVLISATLGASLSFLLAKTVLRGRVVQMLHDKPKLVAVDRAISAQGTKLMLLCRLSGFPPFILANYVFGLTGVSWPSFVLTTLIGSIPGTIVFTYAGVAGAAVATGSGNKWTLILSAVGIVLVGAYVARIALTAIKRAGVETE